MPTDSAPQCHPSWPAAARALVERAIDRHGGWSIGSRLEWVTVRPRFLRGVLPWFKGHPRSFQHPRSIKASPRRWRSEWKDYPTAGSLGIFDRGDVRLRDAATGRLTAESPNHRRTFRGLRKYRRWSPLDALYFFGYAFSSYAAVPFLLPRLRYVGAVSSRWAGERMAGVRVAFPPGWHVHSRVQSYYFDAGGLLRRHDYVADIVGSWAMAAQSWDDYVTVQGIPIPGRRTVFWRLGRSHLPGVIVLASAFEGIAVELAEGRPPSAGHVDPPADQPGGAASTVVV